MSYSPSELFASTAPYYKYRPGYPDVLFDHLTARCALDGTQSVLDLGTGTGAVAIPLSKRVRTVIAVDPDPDMLGHGCSAAAEAGADNIDWRLGDSERIGELGLDHLHMATFGQSFHWTDRDALLATLDTLITPDGAVVVIGGPAPGIMRPPAWADTIAEIRMRYLGPERRAGSSTYEHPVDSHADVLQRSAFSRIETTRWERVVARTLDEVIGLQFSYSYSSSAQLGPDKSSFAADVRDALMDLNPSGTFEETVHTEALIAFRP
jgi:ubiquinone/menaquinone biosynthesis C-methylase UbiE